MDYTPHSAGFRKACEGEGGRFFCIRPAVDVAGILMQLAEN